MKTKNSQAIRFITTTAVLAALYAVFTIACVGIVFSPRLAIAILFPIISNAFIVGWELTYFGEPFWFSVDWVALGEAVVLIAGYFLYFLLRKRPYFYSLVDATQNINFKW